VGAITEDEAMNPVRWGILSTAKIGVDKVIPAIQKADSCVVAAIASRDLARAKSAADALGIPRAYGTYDALLADPDIDAIYNPLPNHLHIPWSAKAAEAGKHVLCEKPLALTAAEARTLIDVRDRTGVLIQEAFMVRHHPQWRRAREIIRAGRIGPVRAVQGCFTYNNPDPANIRNQADIGGGALYDIGSYAITAARFLFDAEPLRAVAMIDRDPTFGTDRLTTALLQFREGQAVFTCATQTVRYQALTALGTDGWLRLELPFVMEPDRACRLMIGDGTFPGALPTETESLDPVDHYTVQADDFAAAICDGRPLEYPLENAVANMRVIDAVFRSAETGGWQDV
jgi:predicted dehydrogenase